ncbi:MAG: glutamate--tRNA ligase [Candidatus Carsonella ruddii]|nr:MAG: glutamate--tRNA ligase [Candidatus Carsonella ruddii]WMC19387.1 MAG: glutamate--tRNA ligase [Candidatus Carsonella ruddii]
MYNIRIAITPSGIPHLGNCYIFLINYILKNKILGNLILRFDDTNQKKNKIINKFFIIKNLKKNGIFIKNIIKQTSFIFFYIKKKNINKKICFKKIFINNNIKKKNLSYSISYIINNCKINFFDNNFKSFKYKINFNVFPIFRKNFIPIYNYSSLIDDYLQNIFIILRGKEWLNQIPLQIILLKNFQFKNQFNHLPNINYLNNKKLSKRNKINFKFNIFIFFKKNKNFFKNNKDFKFVFQNKKKSHIKKINNFIMINLLYFIKNLSIENFSMFLKSKILYLKDLEFNINFSNLDFFKKIFENLKDLNINDKILSIIKNIKNYEFI